MMSFFKRRRWSIAGVPTLDLSAERAEVDIGFLGGEEHRQAFAAVFAKVLRENQALLVGRRIVRAEGERPLPEAGKYLPFAIGSADPTPLALALYDSRNERVRLILEGSAAAEMLFVEFDNPQFWLEAPSA
jgi:hypothetical protein